MSKFLIRLKKVVITNIKNVKYGEIDLPSETFTTEEVTKSDVVGIYGQNGSGKTALVDAMWIVKSLMSGDKLPEDVADYIFQNEEKAKIELTYNLTSNNKYIIFYEVYLKKNEDSVANVVKEYLSYKKYEDNQWTRRAGIIDYDINYKDYIFKPIKNYKLITSNNEDAQIDLRVAKKISKKDNTSFIFSNELEEIIKNKDSFSEFARLVMAMKEYAKVNLFIIRSDHSGLINMNVLMPFSFRLLEENRVTQGDLAISLLKPSTIPNKIFQIINKIICQMNIVLETIIPAMSIGIKDYGMQLTENGEEGRSIDLGGQKEKLYQETKSYEIRRAFRKAGSDINEN